MQLCIWVYRPRLSSATFLVIIVANVRSQIPHKFSLVGGTLWAVIKSIKLFWDTISLSTIRYSIRGLDEMILPISGHKGGKKKGREQAMRRYREKVGVAGGWLAKSATKSGNNEHCVGEGTKERAIKRGNRRKGRKEINKVGHKTKRKMPSVRLLNFASNWLDQRKMGGGDGWVGADNR